ncbi:MAG: hypothetical protein QXL35_06420 [Candidatus Bathyarchaeia archaeon]
MSLMSSLAAVLIGSIASIIVVSPALWIAGRALVGKEKAKFTDAIFIVLIGTLINAVLSMFLGGLPGLIRFVIIVFVWLALIRHFFDTGWLRALLISIVAVVILIVILLILSAIGLTIGAAILPKLL